MRTARHPLLDIDALAAIVVAVGATQHGSRSDDVRQGQALLPMMAKPNR